MILMEEKIVSTKKAENHWDEEDVFKVNKLQLCYT